MVCAFCRRRSLLTFTNVCGRSAGAVDSPCSEGVLATIGGTTRATQLSIGIVLFEKALLNAM